MRREAPQKFSVFSMKMHEFFYMSLKNFANCKKNTVPNNHNNLLKINWHVLMRMRTYIVKFKTEFLFESFHVKWYNRTGLPARPSQILMKICIDILHGPKLTFLKYFGPTLYTS